MFATDIEEIVVIGPGEDIVVVSVPLGVTLVSWEGAQYGTFKDSVFTYEPDLEFWQVGSDVIHLHYVDSGVDVAKRVLLVAGDTDWDGDVATLDPLGGSPSNWFNWTISTSPAPTTTTGPGGGTAYVLNSPTSGSGPSISAGIMTDDGGSQGPTTSTTAMDVTIRDIPTGVTSPTTLPPLGVEFFTISEGVVGIASLEADWNDTTNQWELILKSGSSSNTLVYPLTLDTNFVEVVRSTPIVGNPSTSLIVNENIIGSVPTTAHASLFEQHQLLVNELPGQGSGADSDLLFEKPTARSSRTSVDPSSRVVYENFTGGATGWTVGNPGPQSTVTQSLPGPGDQLDIDLGLMSSLQSSYIEQSVTYSAFDPRPQRLVAAPGHAVRFWVDLSDITIEIDKAVSLVAVCPSVVSGLPCNAIRVWIEYDGTDYTIGANAGLAVGNTPSIALVSKEGLAVGEYRIEARMRNAYDDDLHNGWLDLYVNGVLAERQEGLDNYQHVPDIVRFGVLGDTASSSGVIELDDFEMWAFE
ncbi:MAG: hypothetical protein AAGD38_22070 [Acidobacteriota bacterium]